MKTKQIIIIICLLNLLLVFKHELFGESYNNKLFLTKQFYIAKSQQEVSDDKSVEFQDEKKTKSPVLGCFLSWLIPGLGQFYAGKPGWGVFFLITRLGTAIPAYIFLTDEKTVLGDYEGSILGGDYHRDVKTVKDEDNDTLGYLLLGGAVIFALADYISVYNSIDKYNKSTSKQQKESRIKIKINEREIRLCYKF